MRLTLSFLLLLSALSSGGQYYDWPMWRSDAGHTASTPEQPADRLYLQWQANYTERTPVWDDPLNQNLMQFDRVFEPVVANGRIFLGFNDEDKVVALDLATGKELWHFYTDGPVRLPPAINRNKVYFTGDDGYCYCLDAATGTLFWKISLAPAANKLLGNKRMISMWPARGGIVIKDDILYTAAGIFPMMGTFIYAIDTETGRILWKNEGTGSDYILQPHRSPAFAGVAPQGTFAISGNRLLVAGGRTVPAGFDLDTGEEIFYHLAESGKTGGGFICAGDHVYFNHHRERMTYMYDPVSGKKLLEDAGEYPALDGNTAYFSGDTVTAVRLGDHGERQTLWKIKADAVHDLIKAGNCLFAAGDSGVSAIKLDGNKPVKSWTYPSDQSIERLLAANGKLIAVTREGSILVFGDKPVERITVIEPAFTGKKASSPLAEKIIRSTGITSGYGLVAGTGDPDLLESLVNKTTLCIIALEKDPARIEYLREYFNVKGIHADRLCFLDFEEYLTFLPKYFSSLTIVTGPGCLEGDNAGIITSLYEATRPYDGRIWLNTKGRQQGALMKTIANLGLYGADMTGGHDYIMVTRTGALKGAADWTHTYGNISNTVKSDDEIVKAPLGILWFGGNSNLDVLPRHGHGPPEQVIDGRLIIQGVSSMSARDVYTGRMLWKHEFEGIDKDTWLVYYDESYDGDSPLETKYNQEHLPGANARGTNFIATREYIYVIEGSRCHVLDITTGETVKVITTGKEKTNELGYIGIYDSLLILGSNFTNYPEIRVEDDKPEKARFSDFSHTASEELIILNRYSGETLWSIRSVHGFIHNAVIAGDGILFCLDKLPQGLETKLKRRGEDQPAGSRLLYIDIRTGEILHEEKENIFGSWLGYSAKHKLLLQANRPSRDMLTGEEGKRMIVYNTLTRKILWDKPAEYSNPPIISGEKIYTNGEAFSLMNGEQVYENDLLTGEEVPWNFKREYGCGYVIASEHLLTFRSASAGFVNLDVFEGTGNLGGFKAGCSANLIVADGVLNSPDYTRTCQCPYQNQTSLALINMPWMSYWTNSNYKWSGKQIKQLGLNLNAPGDRTSDDNTLWLEYPYTGTSPEIPVKIDTAGYRAIRKEPVSVDSENMPWIISSSIEGLRSLEITLSKEENVPDASYMVTLYFCEPENAAPGDRIFDVILQDRRVLDDLDIMKETGRKDRELVKSFSGIRAGRTIRLSMFPEKGNTILSGIRIEQEKMAENQMTER